jgi:hypothetical protein
MVAMGPHGGVYNAWDNVAAAATDSVLVTNPSTTRKIRVLRVFLNATDAGVSTFTFNSKGGGAGTAISPTFETPLNGGFVLGGGDDGGWFETNVGESLTITTAAASTVSIIVVWEFAD